MNNKFGERLKELRIKNNLSQIQLAKILNVNSTTINKWEKNINTPRPFKVIEVCKYFHVSFDYLLGLSNSPEIKKRKF